MARMIRSGPPSGGVVINRAHLDRGGVTTRIYR